MYLWPQKNKFSVPGQLYTCVAVSDPWLVYSACSHTVYIVCTQWLTFFWLMLSVYMYFLGYMTIHNIYTFLSNGHFISYGHPLVPCCLYRYYHYTVFSPPQIAIHLAFIYVCMYVCMYVYTSVQRQELLRIRFSFTIEQLHVYGKNILIEEKLINDTLIQIESIPESCSLHKMVPYI